MACDGPVRASRIGWGHRVTESAIALAARIGDLRPTAVNSILSEVAAVRHQGIEVVSLMRGEPDFATPPHIVEAAIQALRAGRTSYPDNRGEAGLREAVARKLAREHRLEYDPASEVLITDGATLGVYAAIMALLNPGDEVLLPDPIYDAYQSPIRLSGARASAVRSVRTNGRFQITVDALEAARTSNTRALLLNTPWNPTGTVFTREELIAIGAFVELHNLFLISDEIYETIVYDGHTHVALPSAVPSLRDRCVILNSFSKTYAMTGWRLGYCAGPAPIIQAMLLVLQQSSRGPAKFVQDAGVAALDGPQECVRDMQQAYVARRQAVSRALAPIPSLAIFEPEGGFFTMVDVSRLGSSSDAIRRDLLQSHGVVVIHGAAYGQGGEGTLRVSFAAGGATLDQGLEKLREGLSSL